MKRRVYKAGILRFWASSEKNERSSSRSAKKPDDIAHSRYYGFFIKQSLLIFIIPLVSWSSTSADFKFRRNKSILAVPSSFRLRLIQTIVKWHFI